MQTPIIPNMKIHKSPTSGLSGNEMYCLHYKGFSPGDLVIGNSVFSLGVLGSISSGVRTLIGGEVTPITQIIHEGRKLSYDRMIGEAQKHGGVGISGVRSELIMHQGNIEYLSIGSSIHRDGTASEKLEFTTSDNGQDLYCQMDCGFKPVKFVFGNVAYSIGVAGGLGGLFRSFGRGEVHEFSHIFNETRHLALNRMIKEAQESGANAVVGIETTIIPFQGMQEMLMIGTAAKHPLFSRYTQTCATSDLTSPEMWSTVHLGYMPLRLVMGVSVYSIGIMGGISSFFQSLRRGEMDAMTELIYEARENAINKVHQEAKAYGADAVFGIKTYIYEIGGGLIEFFAIGTAVKKVEGLTTETKQLPPQAIITDRDTFVNNVDTSVTELNRTGSGAKNLVAKGSPILAALGIAIYFIISILHSIMRH